MVFAFADVPSEELIAAAENGHTKIVEILLAKGTINLSFDTMSANFDDKTKCMVNDKEYIFMEGKWIEN